MRNDVPFKFLATSNRRCRTLFQFFSGFCLARGGAMKVKYYELSRDQQCRWSSSCSLTLNTSVGVLGNEKTKKEVWWIVVINSGYSKLQKWSSNHAQARCAPTPQLATDQNLILRLNDPKMLFPKQQQQREEPPIHIRDGDLSFTRHNMMPGSHFALHTRFEKVEKGTQNSTSNNNAFTLFLVVGVCRADDEKKTRDLLILINMKVISPQKLFVHFVLIDVDR